MKNNNLFIQPLFSPITATTDPYGLRGIVHPYVAQIVAGFIGVFGVSAGASSCLDWIEVVTKDRVSKRIRGYMALFFSSFVPGTCWLIFIPTASLPLFDSNYYNFYRLIFVISSGMLINVSLTVCIVSTT